MWIKYSRMTPPEANCSIRSPAGQLVEPEPEGFATDGAVAALLRQPAMKKLSGISANASMLFRHLKDGVCPAMGEKSPEDRSINNFVGDPTQPKRDYQGFLSLF